MAVDPLDPVERLTGQRDQCKADRDADFTDDPDASRREADTARAEIEPATDLSIATTPASTAPSRTASKTARQVGNACRSGAATAAPSAAPGPK